MTESCDLAAVEARRLIGAKKLSPVELLESCIERIEAVNPAINAVVPKDYDRARKAATAAEGAVRLGCKLGARHGRPLGETGIASGRERGCPGGTLWGVSGTLKKN